MSSIVTSILSSTVGLLWNKVRDTTAKHLKDSGITNAQIRQAVVRELNDIDTKLDGLSRKDLLSSYSFLEEGVQLLNASFEKFEQKPVVNEGDDDRGKISRTPSSGGGESDILNEVIKLSRAMGKLEIDSIEFDSAKERFKDARKEATHAFCNEALSIRDRIFAAKLRVVSEIFECLDNPDTAAISCLSFLKKLHGLPDIREIFSVYLDGGVKSVFNKTERAENVKSVMMINYVLYRFVLKFGSKYCSVLAWPTIQLSTRSFNPIFNWQVISTRESWGEDFKSSPFVVYLDKLISFYSAVNSRGEIVSHGSGEMMISRVLITVLPFPTEDKEAKVIEADVEYLLGLALDEEDNVYVSCYATTSGNVNGHTVLYILDRHFRLKQKSTLHFLSKLHEIGFELSPMAVNKNGNIVLALNMPGERYVYVCDNTGQLKCKFEWEPNRLIVELFPKVKQISISNKNEIIVTCLDNTVYLYTEKGELKLIIKLPADHQILGAVFHFVLRKIIVLSFFEKEFSCYLHSYSETGELENSWPLCRHGSEKYVDLNYPIITSHPSGSSWCCLSSDMHHVLINLNNKRHKY